MFDFRFEDLGDYFTLSEIFLNDEYAVDLPDDPEIIFDLGCNIGLTLLYFRLRYPQAQIYGFEPDPNNFRRLAPLVRQWPNMWVYNLAISSSDGTMPFFVDPHRSHSSSAFQRRDRQQQIEVQSRKLDTVIQEVEVDHVDLLKFDIEGAEFDVFRHFEQKHLVKTYLGEVHADVMAAKPEDVAALFNDYEVTISEIAPRRYQLLARRQPNAKRLAERAAPNRLQ